MGWTQNCGCCHRNQKLIFPLISLLILSSLTNAGYMVEGRTISKLFHSASQVDHAPKGIREEKVVVSVAGVGRRRALIGSRPPRCDRRCSSCGHCEAIQVPIVPLLRNHNNMHATPIRSSIASSRGEYISNYKPICWKCKCGDFIFDP
ncbi:hypothetical protein RHMOL_Rhmol06G0082400 [Rhododendron molle]|uniref:Uncharacterized protein n=1 Tax=Rhododendron molle TaxID=49168 RepID=A0ACC0NA73_RHOML|nr:hypothetical protein RHMOL_Rhmol06G0082400 [Rhododendron molle]